MLTRASKQTCTCTIVQCTVNTFDVKLQRWHLGNVYTLYVLVCTAHSARGCSDVEFNLRKYAHTYTRTFPNTTSTTRPRTYDTRYPGELKNPAFRWQCNSAEKCHINPHPCRPETRECAWMAYIVEVYYLIVSMRVFKDVLLYSDLWWVRFMWASSRNVCVHNVQVSLQISGKYQLFICSDICS